MGKKVDFKTKILTEEEVEVLTEALREMFGPEICSMMDEHEMDMDRTVRFSSVAHRCREVREKKGLTIKEVAAELKVPQYRIKDIEQGGTHNLKSDVLLKYTDFLRLSRWFSRWEKANSKLVEELFPDLEEVKGKRKSKRKPNSKKKTD